MDLWQRLDDVADRWNVLSHPFYQRWSEGELSSSELAFYAGQYAHAVDALAAAPRHAADDASPPRARPPRARTCRDRKSHRLYSRHLVISFARFRLTKNTAFLND